MYAFTHVKMMTMINMAMRFTHVTFSYVKPILIYYPIRKRQTTLYKMDVNVTTYDLQEQTNSRKIWNAKIFGIFVNFLFSNCRYIKLTKVSCTL